jgi:hypothetical protein
MDVCIERLGQDLARANYAQSTQRRYRRTAQQLSAHTGKPLAKPTQDDVRAFVEAEERGEGSPSAVPRCVARRRECATARLRWVPPTLPTSGTTLLNGLTRDRRPNARTAHDKGGARRDARAEIKCRRATPTRTAYAKVARDPRRSISLGLRTSREKHAVAASNCSAVRPGRNAQRSCRCCARKCDDECTSHLQHSIGGSARSSVGIANTTACPPTPVRS